MPRRSGLLRFLQRHVLNPRRKEWRNRKLRLLIERAETTPINNEGRKPYPPKPQKSPSLGRGDALCVRRGGELGEGSPSQGLRSELELGLDDAAPDVGAAVAAVAAVLASAIVAQLLARHPEHARSHADVVADLELIPGLQRNRHAAVGAPTGVVARHARHTTNGETSLVAFNEHVFEVQADHPAVGLSRIASVHHVDADHAAVVARAHRVAAVSTSDLEAITPLVRQGEAVLVGLDQVAVAKGVLSQLGADFAHRVHAALIGVVGREQPLLAFALPGELDGQTEAGVASKKPSCR